MDSANSDWPLPSTPAIPNISPSLTEKLTPSIANSPRLSITFKFSTSNNVFPGYYLTYLTGQKLLLCLPSSLLVIVL